jgi:hypothetical protein
MWRRANDRETVQEHDYLPIGECSIAGLFLSARSKKQLHRRIWNNGPMDSVFEQLSENISRAIRHY